MARSIACSRAGSPIPLVPHEHPAQLQQALQRACIRNRREHLFQRRLLSANPLPPQIAWSAITESATAICACRRKLAAHSSQVQLVTSSAQSVHARAPCARSSAPLPESQISLAKSPNNRLQTQCTPQRLSIHVARRPRRTRPHCSWSLALSDRLRNSMDPMYSLSTPFTMHYSSPLQLATSTYRTLAQQHPTQPSTTARYPEAGACFENAPLLTCTIRPSSNGIEVATKTLLLVTTLESQHRSDTASSIMQWQSIAVNISVPAPSSLAYDMQHLALHKP